MDTSGVKPIGVEPTVPVARMIDGIPQWVVDYAKGRGRNTDVGEWIVSLLREEEKPPSLKGRIADTIIDLTDISFGESVANPDEIAAEVLRIVAADIKEHFGWETRITGYLREQAK